jgi:hypothetical protein
MLQDMGYQISHTSKPNQILITDQAPLLTTKLPTIYLSDSNLGISSDPDHRIIILEKPPSISDLHRAIQYLSQVTSNHN